MVLFQQAAKISSKYKYSQCLCVINELMEHMDSNCEELFLTLHAPKPRNTALRVPQEYCPKNTLRMMPWYYLKNTFLRILRV